MGSIEKLEYRCTTRNLPLCNGTIIVLKLHCFIAFNFVITNFVIPKRDKNEQKTSHFFVYIDGARPTIPTIIGMVTEEARPVFCTPTFFDLVTSFAASGY